MLDHRQDGDGHAGTIIFPLIKPFADSLLAGVSNVRIENMKIMLSLAATAAVGFFLMAGATTHANAATCYYGTRDLNGKVLDVRGVATAAKSSTACDRARRECNRRLERAYRNGKMPRGVVCFKYG